MQKGVVTFEDLHEGMMITGKVKNVVDFGAFVDVGIKETALLHISEMSDSYIQDPMEVLKVGDVREFRIIGLDLDRRRISLSLKSQNSGGTASSGASRSGTSVAGNRHSGPSSAGSRNSASASSRPGSGHSGTASNRPGSGHSGTAQTPTPQGETGRRVVVVKKAGDQKANSRDDDGTMYNPFAEALRKMQEKSGKK